MDHFTYQQGELRCEAVSLRALADAVGTPALLHAFTGYQRAFRSVTVTSAGAHASGMASNDNTRLRAVEVLVDGDRYTIVRRRETSEDLVAGETVV